jgi:Interleukin-like EMT inducer
VLLRLFYEVCQVEAVSWGIQDNTSLSGYININGTRVISTTSTAYRGFNLLELDVSSCSSTKIRHYDTNEYTANSEKMATYITSLPLNTVLIGVTADDAQHSLTNNATSALLAIGVNVTGLEFRGKVSFVALIGQPTSSVSQVAPAGGENAKIFDSFTGRPICHLSGIWYSRVT